jgi:iron(III) transport system substrate-binding protein
VPAPESKPLSVEEVASLDAGPERQRLLEEGARREGQVVLYTTSTGLDPMAQAFMQRYPFVKMEIVATRSEPLTQRTQAEGRAGRLGGDVLKTNVFVADNLRDLLLKFNSPGARFDRVPYAASADLTGIIFIYHTGRVAAADVPSRVEDLLRPRWQQNVALQSPPSNFAGRWVGALLEHLGEPATRDYLRRLGDQRPYHYSQPDAGTNGLLAGEWDIVMHGMANAVTAMRAGAPVAWVALDPTTLSPDILGLFKQAQHPYAAMLFLDWVIGPEGQRTMNQAQGSFTLEEVDRREKDGVKLPARITFQSPADAARLDGWTALFDELVVRK